jgi:hypothetical protein
MSDQHDELAAQIGYAFTRRLRDAMPAFAQALMDQEQGRFSATVAFTYNPKTEDLEAQVSFKTAVNMPAESLKLRVVGKQLSLFG